MKKMVIAQILPALEIGGVERGTIEIATALKKAGITNYVISYLLLYKNRPVFTYSLVAV